MRLTKESIMIAVIAVMMVGCVRHDYGVSHGAIRGAYEYLMREADSNLDNNDKVVVMEEKYRVSMSGYQKNNIIDGLSNDDLESLYGSSNIVAFYTQKPGYVYDMKRDVDALRKRHLASERHYRDLYGAYVSARMFDEAKGLLEQYNLPGVEKIPKVNALPSVEGLPRAFLVDDKSHSLNLRSIDIKNGVNIVVVAHPLCHFSTQAIRYIYADNALRELFDQYALWLVPPSREIEFDLIRAWSLSHAKESTMIAYSREDWPMISSWNTPTFYFLKDGKVVDVVVGWPKQGNGVALRAALRKAGLEPGK